MNITNFENLRDLVGGELGNSKLRQRLFDITNIYQIDELVNEVKQLCSLAYKEFETNSLGLSSEVQLSYIEDILYIFDEEIQAHKVRTHTSRWETWLAYHLKKLQGRAPIESELNHLLSHMQGLIDMSNEYHIDSIQGICIAIAVRGYFEYLGTKVHGDNLYIPLSAFKASILMENYDQEFLREYTSTLVDDAIFNLRRKIYQKYIFKGGKRLSAWHYWHENESNYHSGESAILTIISDSKRMNHAPPSIPPLSWLGSGTELLDLFATLSEKGYISLPSPGESRGVSLERIAKAICSLFDISGIRRKDSKSPEWVTIYQYFKETSKDRITKQYTYDRLKEGKRNFESINAPKPRSKSSK